MAMLKICRLACIFNKISSHYALVTGVCLGVLLFLQPSLFFLFFLLLLVALSLSGLDHPERIVLVRILFVALFLRVFFAFLAVFCIQFMSTGFEGHPVLIKLLGHSNQLFRDFHREVLNGIRLSDYFTSSDRAVSLEAIAFDGHTTYLNFGAYFQSFLHVLFGKSFLNILSFSIISLFSVVVIYYLAKELFNKAVAVFSAWVLALMPSFVIWSNINIRIMLGIIAMMIIGLALAKLSKTITIKSFFLLCFGLGILNISKGKFMRPLWAIFPLIFLLCLRIRLSKKIKMLILAAALILFFISTSNSAQAKIQDLILNIVDNQKSFALYESGNNYRIYDDFVYSTNIEDVKARLTPLFIMKALPKGIGYFMFSPFPWAATNTLRFISYPQIILWYFMVFFASIGILLGMRHSLQKTLLMLAWVFPWIILLSLTMGNDGIVARQRDLIAPFFFIYSSAGVMHLLGRKIY